MPERCPTVLRNSFWLERWEILTPTQLNSALLAWSLSKVSFKDSWSTLSLFARGSRQERKRASSCRRSFFWSPRVVTSWISKYLMMAARWSFEFSCWANHVSCLKRSASLKKVRSFSLEGNSYRNKVSVIPISRSPRIILYFPLNGR